MAEMETFELWVSSQVPLVPGRLQKKKKRKEEVRRERREGEEGGRDLPRLEPERAERSVPCASRAEARRRSGSCSSAGRLPENIAGNIAGIPA